MHDDELYRTYRRYVAAVARAAAPAADVDDVVQDVFLAALAGRGSLRDPSRLRAWLRGVALRAARSRLRRRAVRRRVEASLDGRDLVGRVACGGCPEALLDARLAHRALAALPASVRDAWWARRVEGGTVEEVAAAAGCSASTVKRRVREADEALRGP